VALGVALSSFAYPIRIVQRIIYCHLTRRKRHFSNEEWLELIFAAATLTWLADFLKYLCVPKQDSAIPGLDTTYIGSVVLDLKEGGAFRINFLLSVVAASFWFKVLFMLQLTKTFGPMIKIIVSMLTDLATFTVLWIIQLFIFACIGYLIFGELYEYRDLQNTLIMLLESSLGHWDFNIYNDLKIGRMYGVGYHIVVITVNMILLLNLVIAILTETYVRFS
jgi:hypothetical protein